MERRAPRTLVTGANGTIGRVLRERLTPENIVFTDRDSLDVAQAANLVGHLDGFGAVVNLASTLKGPGLDAHRAAYSLRLARNVVRAAISARVPRVILMSSVRAAPLPEAWRGRGGELQWPPLVGRVGRAIERLGRRAAGSGLDVVVVRCGGVNWPDHRPRGLEACVWLSHEDCASLFERCLSHALTPGRCAVFAAVSDTPLRLHDTANPIGWVSTTHNAGLKRFLRYRAVQLKSLLQTGMRRAAISG